MFLELVSILSTTPCHFKKLEIHSYHAFIFSCHYYILGIVNKTLINLYQNIKSIFVLLSLTFKYMQSKFSYCMKKLCIIFFDEFDKSHDKRSNGVDVDVNKQQ